MQVIESKNLQLVSLSGAVEQAEIPSSGKISLAENTTLTAKNFIIATAENAGTVEFGSEIILNGSETFVLTAENSTAYNLNGVTYNILATATIDSEANLVEDTIQVSDQIKTLNGKTFKTLDEITLAVNEAIPAFKAGTVELPIGDEISAGSDITVSAEDGAAKIIGALDEGDTFTLNGDEYEMTELGLLKNGELISGTDAETSEFDLSGEINLLKLIAVDGEITLELAEENSGGTVEIDSSDETVAPSSVLFGGNIYEYAGAGLIRNSENILNLDAEENHSYVDADKTFAFVVTDDAWKIAKIIDEDNRLRLTAIWTLN